MRQLAPGQFIRRVTQLHRCTSKPCQHDVLWGAQHRRDTRSDGVWLMIGSCIHGYRFRHRSSGRLLVRRLALLALAAASLTSCAWLPIGASPSPSSSIGQTPQPTSPPGSPDPPTISPAPTPSGDAQDSPTPFPTESAGLVDLASSPWLQWLPNEGSDFWSLYTGRLDGRAFEAIDSGQPVTAPGNRAGPVNGEYLSLWLDADESVLSLIDTVDGSTREMVRSHQRLASGAITPDGASLLWTTLDDDGSVSGVWRQPTSGLESEKVLDGWDGPGPNLVFSIDGSIMVFSNWSERSDGYSYRLFNANLEPVGQLLDTSFGPPIGFLDNRLIVYEQGAYGQVLEFPLLALDIEDWSAQTFVSSEGRSAAIVAAQDGTPVLLFDGHEGDDRYAINASTGEGDDRTIFVGGAPWYDAPTSMVLPMTTDNVAAPPGWIAVFPGGRPIPRSSQDEGGVNGRVLVRISDGEMIDVPAFDLTR